MPTQKAPTLSRGWGPFAVARRDRTIVRRGQYSRGLHLHHRHNRTSHRSGGPNARMEVRMIPHTRHPTIEHSACMDVSPQREDTYAHALGCGPVSRTHSSFRRCGRQCQSRRAHKLAPLARMQSRRCPVRCAQCGFHIHPSSALVAYSAPRKCASGSRCAYKSTVI